MTGRRPVARRALLRAAAAAGAVSVAGCGQSDDVPRGTAGTTETATERTRTPTPEPAVFRVVELDTSPGTVKQAHESTIVATVRNDGGTAARATLAVTVDGDAVHREVVDLAASGSTDLSVAVRPGVPGEHTVRIEVVDSPTTEIEFEGTSTTLRVERYPDSFVDVSAPHFVVDGSRFRYNGANCKKLVGAAREYIDDVLADAARMGLRVVRLRCHGEVNCRHFGGASRCEQDSYVFQQAPGSPSEATFRQLDYVVYRAKQHGIRLIPHLTNNWGPADYSGSMNWYVDHSETAERHDDFYTDAETRRMYESYVEHVLTRTNTYTGVEYRDDPTVMLWELANEAKLAHTDEPEGETGRILGDWYREMAEFAKSVDPNHLVSTGAVGLYAPNPEGRAYVDHHGIDAVDACSTHIYPKEPTPDESLAEMACHLGDDPICADVLADRVRDGHDVVGKPVYVGEWGVGDFLWSDDPERGRRVVRNVFEEFYDGFAATDVDGVLVHELFSDDYFTGYDWLEGGEVMAYEYSDEQLREAMQSYSRRVNDAAG